MQLTKDSIGVYEVKFTKLKAKERERIEKSLLIKSRESKLTLTWKLYTANGFDWNDYLNLIGK